MSMALPPPKLPDQIADMRRSGKVLRILELMAQQARDAERAS